MPSQLARDIRQKAKFGSLEQEAFLLLQRTTSELATRSAAVLRGVNLSGSQYNVLRILRGAGAAGLTCGEIGDRLVTRDPDITRLLDRLEKRGLVERHRETTDRRIVTSRVTRQGLELIAPLDAAMQRAHAEQLSHLGEKRLRSLIALLEKARQGKSRQ